MDNLPINTRVILTKSFRTDENETFGGGITWWTRDHNKFYRGMDSRIVET